MIDVDGSYLYRKQQLLTSKAGSINIAIPDMPLSGWEVVEESNYKDVSKQIPVVTHSESTLTFEPLTFDFFLF